MARRLLSLLLVLGTFLGGGACASLQRDKVARHKSAEAHYHIGVRYLQDGEYAQAMLELRKAEVFEPKDPRIQNAMGLVYFATDRPSEAEAAYRKALSLKKDYSEARVNLGTLYARQGRCEEAIPEYRKALEDPFYPTPALALHNIGLCYRSLGREREAEKALREAVDQDPNLFRAYLDLGRLYYAQNRMDEAVKVFRRALDRHPPAAGDPASARSLAYLHYWLGLSYFKNGEAGPAAAQFRDVTRLLPGSPLAEEARKYLDLLE